MTFQLSDFGKLLLLDRYAKKDGDGNPIETDLEQVWGRAAEWAAQAEKPEDRDKWATEFYNALASGAFVPGGRILAAAGIEGLTPYNCFVIPSPEDSRSGIMSSLERWMEIQARGGGVGVSLETLRPRGARVGGVNGTSSGPVTYANLFSNTTATVIQGGSRRGAAMIMISDTHPDLLEFINSKRIPNFIENANISIKISNLFMDAVRYDQPWILEFTDEHGRHYENVERASVIWDAIAESAWASAEPGIVFMERVNNESPIGYAVNHVCTNPCGEIPLGENEVCLLGSINHTALVKDGFNKPYYDYELLKHYAGIAVRFLDNVIDLAYYPFKENEEAQKRIRRLGIGGMGLADAMLELSIRYGSPESIQFTEDVYRTSSIAQWEASALLAKEKGPFPAFDLEQHLYTPLAQRMPQSVRDLIEDYGIRNGVLETQAPTGTTSALMNVSSGIEPVFDYVFRRMDRTGTRVLVHPQVAKFLGPDDDINRLADDPRALAEFFKKLPDHFVSAQTLTPYEHVEVQAAAQKWVGNAISKTTNLPSSYTVEDIKNLYQYAYDQGLKGLTVYRDGSRDEQVLYKLTNDDSNMPLDQPLPEVLNALRFKIRFPAGNGYVVISERAPGDPIELFILLGKSGTSDNASSEALGRMVSALWRHSNLNPKEKISVVLEQLEGIRGDQEYGFGSRHMTTLSDGVVKALKDYQAVCEKYQDRTGAVYEIEDCFTGDCE